MTTDLEKNFFNTFGIEPIIPCYKCSMQNTNWDCKRTCLYDDEKRKEYPQITDRIYLMLLATLTCISSIEFPFSDIQKLKADILKEVTKHQYGFDEQQVQELFKE